MKTKPNVGDKCFYWDNDGERVTAIVQSIDADGIVNFGDDMALHWRALHGRVVKKNKVCDECVDLRDDLIGVSRLYEEQANELRRADLRITELKNQLSGERYWMGCSVNNPAESTGLSWPHPTRELISKNWPYHTEVMVLQTKNASDE